MRTKRRTPTPFQRGAREGRRALDGRSSACSARSAFESSLRTPRPLRRTCVPNGERRHRFNAELAKVAELLMEEALRAQRAPRLNCLCALLDRCAEHAYQTENADTVSTRSSRRSQSSLMEE